MVTWTPQEPRQNGHLEGAHLTLNQLVARVSIWFYYTFQPHLIGLSREGILEGAQGAGRAPGCMIVIRYAGGGGSPKGCAYGGVTVWVPAYRYPKINPKRERFTLSGCFQKNKNTAKPKIRPVKRVVQGG